jgi:hypothetical protein
VHPNLVSLWRQELLKRAAEVFGKPNNNNNKNDRDELIDNIKYSFNK